VATARSASGTPPPDRNADADVLCAYLDKYLPFNRACDQAWAIGALLYLDERPGGNRADRFLTPGASGRTP
jgi:hypothetical protein